MSINYRHNVMDVASPATFSRVRGGCSQGNRDVYFLRMLGATDSLKQEVQEIDALLGAAMEQRQLLYKRLHTLPVDMSEEDRNYYCGCYEQWVSSGGTSMQIRAQQSNPSFSRALGAALKVAEELYDRFQSGNTPSMKRNLLIKLTRWTDVVLAGIPADWTERSCMKIVAENVGKVQEYLFYYTLTLLGADVMLLQTKRDISLPPWLDALSKQVVLGEYVSWELPEMAPPAAAKKAARSGDPLGVPAAEASEAPPLSPAAPPVPVPASHTPIRVTIPERARRSQAPAAAPAPAGRIQQPSSPGRAPTPAAAASSQRREKSFEELALLASSIVMITIHDQTGQAIGSGSGIMVGEDGYILTNFHVVRGGQFFSVQIEDDETVYRTDELIKYHPEEDLAILRISRKLKPLPLYRGKEKLVRGQRVVAIGSPLGLFNSVSDGIISGFRTIDSMDMVQFTAPTSHGSSGGAVLNMFGEVIGISTAGVDQGQNLNLAVSYETISYFIRGFC